MDEMPQPKRGYLSKKQTEFVINDIDQYQVPLSTTKYNIELFKGYKNIIIVGSPRSGTTFTGHALAKSLSLNYVDENSYDLRNVDLFNKIMDRGNNVAQAPGFTHIAHLLANKDNLIVFMVRKWSDIIKSFYRIEGKISNWVYTKTLYDYELFNRINPGIRTKCNPPVDLEVESYFKKYINEDSYLLEVLYKMWKYYQRDKIPNWIQLDYESLSIHPMWVSKKYRKNTTRKQLQVK